MFYLGVIIRQRTFAGVPPRKTFQQSWARSWWISGNVEVKWQYSLLTFLSLCTACLTVRSKGWYCVCFLVQKYIPRSLLIFFWKFQQCVEVEDPDKVVLKAPRTSLSARLSEKPAQNAQRFRFSQVSWNCPIYSIGMCELIALTISLRWYRFVSHLYHVKHILSLFVVLLMAMAPIFVILIHSHIIHL